MIKKNSEQAFFYVFPFAALILFTTINFSSGDDLDAGTASGGSITTLVRMAIYGLALYPFLVRPGLHFPWLIKRWPFLLLLVYVPLSILWSAYPGGVIESTIHFVGGSLGAFAASIYFSKHHEKLFTYLSLIFGISVVVSIATVLMAPEIGIQSFKWEDATRWRGATGNANTLGRISALAVWANVVGLLYNRDNKKLKILHLVIISAAIITIIGSDSKTSQAICLLLVVLVYLLPRILGRNVKKKRKLEVLIAYIFLLIASVALVFSYQTIPDEEALSKVGRDSTYSGRTYVWADANTLINMKPIIGWSFDGRRSAFDEIDPGVPHFHNGYLDFMVRGGMVGFMIFLTLFSRAGWRVLKKSKSRPYIYPHFAALLLSMVIYNLSEVSFGAWSDLMWTMLLFIYFLAERSSRRRRRGYSHGGSVSFLGAFRTPKFGGFSKLGFWKKEEIGDLDSAIGNNKDGYLLSNVVRKRKFDFTKKKVLYSVILISILTGIFALNKYDWGANDLEAYRFNDRKINASKHDDIQSWKGIIFAPEYKTDSEDYIRKFELLVTEALSPLGINLIIFDMHWNNYKFTEVPGLKPLENPPLGVVDAKDAKRMADICRKNGIRVMVGMNFLTHQSYGQLLKAFPEYQWPGNEKLWNPLNTKVNKVAFRMADELIESFGAEGFHVGMDEGWGFNAEDLPEASNYSTAELFAKAINEYHEHFVKEKGIEMIMWSDMLEGKHSDAPVAKAISMIPKDIILSSWDYECHWKSYPGFGRILEEIIPICPWESKGPAKLASEGFRVLVSPWRNPRAARKLAESAVKLKDKKLKGILYTTWSSEVVYDLKDALLENDTKRTLDPTIRGVSESIKSTINLFRDE